MSLESLLILRFVQGFGAAGPRIAGTALIRDLYAGREMARITSFVMMIFIMIPAVAPSLGEFIIDSAGSWRAARRTRSGALSACAEGSARLPPRASAWRSVWRRVNGKGMATPASRKGASIG